MHGRKLVPLLVLLTGCTDSAAPLLDSRKSHEIELGQSFEKNRCGTIVGRVTWDGLVPTPEEKVVRNIAYNPALYKNSARFALPHCPKVDAKSQGVGGAIVYLRNVDPGQSRPWDHAPLRVEFKERRLVIRQGGNVSSVGFVRRGSAIEVANCDEEYHNLYGRGAGHFSLPLLEADRVQSQILREPGLVDLTCGAGYFWLQAHLFVVEHPYYSRTDATGRFELPEVPAGKYELVCWLPNWNVSSHERDPETGAIVRLKWSPPMEQSRPIEVAPQGKSEAEFCWNEAHFHTR